MKILSRIVIFISLISLCHLVSCSPHPYAGVMNEVEALMEEHPDSAFALLNTLDKDSLRRESDKARYALLMSMALDKNYIDTTDFKVLQPAIDYYLKHGTPDEKLTTYHCQGIIYLNRNQSDLAMKSLLKGLEMRLGIKDTLALANLISTRGVIQFSIYAYEDYTRSSLDAMELYRSIGHKDYEILSIAKALDGSIAIDDRHMADSLIPLARRELNHPSKYSSNLKNVILEYVVNYGGEEEIRNLLSRYSPADDIPLERRLDILMGYCKIKDTHNATAYFNSIDTGQLGSCKMKYLAIKPDYFELKGDAPAALKAYREYMDNKTERLEEIMSRDLLFTQEHHDAEMARMKEIHHRDLFINIALASLCLLLIILGSLYYLWKRSRSKRELSEKENVRLRLKNENQKLILDNQLLKIEKLEAERENLKQLLNDREALSGKAKDIVKHRLDMLNEFFASLITQKQQYSKSFDERCNRLLEDKDEFMESNQLAIRASNPGFIEHLEQRGLTVEEINYACLYLIGLTGKEVGHYIQLKRHYHISCDIRRKLGINPNSTNLGNYLRNLRDKLSNPD